MIEIERAAVAKEVLDNSEYRRAIMEVKADLFNEWTRNTIWSGVKKREKLWAMMQAATELEDKLAKVLMDGKIKAKQVARAEKVSKIR